MFVLKKILKLILIIFLFFLILWVIFLGTLQTKIGQEWFLKQGNSLLKSKTGLTVEYDQLEFIFPLSLRVHNLTLTNRAEKWLNVQQIDLFCLYPHLLQGQLICSNLRVKGLTVFSLGTQNTSSSSREFSFPYYIKIENIDIQDIRLAPTLISQFNLPSPAKEQLNHSSFNLKGMIGHNPLKPSLNLHMMLTALDLYHERPPLTLGINAQNNQLSLTLHSHALPLPNFPFIASVAAYAIAPFQSWKDLIENKSLHIPLKGHFKLGFPEKELVIKSKYRLLSPQDIQLHELLAFAPGISLQGESRIKNLEIEEGTFAGEITDENNKIFVTGNLKGLFTNLVLDLEAHSPQINWHNQLFENVQSSVQSRIQGEYIEGQTSLDFILKDIPYHAKTDFKWNKSAARLLLKDLVIEALQAHLNGEMQISTPDFIVDGFLQTQAASLAPLAQLAGLKIEGQADLNLNFKPIVENQNIYQGFECYLKGKDIRWNDLSVRQMELDSRLHSNSTNLTAHLEVSQLQWKGETVEHAACLVNCQDFWQNPHGRMEFVIHQAQKDNLSIRQLNGETTFSKTEQPWLFHLKGEGLSGEKWALETHGDWHTDFNHLQIRLAQLKGNYGELPVMLIQPVIFSYEQEKIIIEPLHMRWGEGEVRASFAGQKQNFALDFSTNSISSKFLQTINPSLPLKGLLSVKGHLEGDLQMPVGGIDIIFQDLEISDNYLANPTPINGEVHLKLLEKHIQIAAQVFDIGRSPLLFKGILPYYFSLLPFNFQTNPNIALAIDVAAEGDLDTYLPMLAADFPNISGQFKLAAQLGGNIQQPQLKGYLKVMNGIYEHTETGAIYNQIQADLEGQGNKLVLKKFSAYDNKNGSIHMDGAIDLDISKNFPFDFHIQATRLHVLDSDFATISVSGPLNLKGNTKKAKLSGHLNTDQAEARLAESLPKQIKTIDIQYINLPEGQQAPRNDKNNGEALELDIKITAAEVAITNNSLKSSWKGEIAVTGTTKQPLLAGDLRISKGEYKIQGKSFNLSQGSIHFAGAAAKKTTLYIVASKEIDNIKAEIIVKGPLNKLEVSFRSNPPLSQREVLSYILFNRGISDITPGEGDTLNQSFILLNSSEHTEEKQDLLTRLRNNIGIDRLDFTAAGEGENKDFALQVGKYIFKDVFISLNKSIGAAADRVAIEAKLMKNVKAEAEVDIGTSSQGKVSLKWKRDY